MADLERVEFAHKIRAFHHASLWEEEKHFTWLNSLTLSAELLLITSDKMPLPFRSRLVLVLLVSVLGFLISIIALRVIRREGGYFHDALSQFVREYNAVFADNQIPPVPRKANKSYGELIKSFITGKVGTRDMFQIIFLAFAAVFLILLCTSRWLIQSVK